MMTLLQTQKVQALTILCELARIHTSTGDALKPVSLRYHAEERIAVQFLINSAYACYTCNPTMIGITPHGLKFVNHVAAEIL